MSKRGESPSDARSIHSNGHLALAKSVLEAPSIQVDGVKYLSDRFYLNHVNVGNDTQLPMGTSTGNCTCGAHQPPPLLNREALVNSLQLKAAILGTFCVDLDWLAATLPRLVGPNATVPTLLLHGDKTLPRRLLERQKAQPRNNDDDDDTSCSSLLPDSEEQENSIPDISAISAPLINLAPNKLENGLPAEPCPVEDLKPSRFCSGIPSLGRKLTNSNEMSDESSSEDGASSRTQDETTMESNHQNCNSKRDPLNESPSLPRAELNRVPQPRPVKPSVATVAQAPAQFSPETMASSSSRSLDVHCHVTQVRSAWNPKGDSRVTHETRRTPSSTKEPPPPKEWKGGVHHPKFMILLETSGDVVVVISTANLTPTRTVEGTWVQRFKPNRRACRRSSASTTPKRQKKVPYAARPSTNDFGEVLQDFLRKLDGSAVEGQTTIRDFLEQYLQMRLSELAEAFHFEKASCNLVPVIPGDWKSQPSKQQPFVYGRQRVQQVLQGHQTVFQSPKDRLIVQPTSFGGNWSRGLLADVVRSYLNYDEHNADADYWNEEALLDRMDIVWPSRAYIRTANQTQKVVDEANLEWKKQTSKTTKQDYDHSFVFLSSNTFNSCDQASVSRMARFQVSEPAQCPKRLVPHFKSIGRLLVKKSAVKRQGFDGRAEEYLSWFLLTSACLSMGAQGKRLSRAGDKAQSNKTQYANFELGVLFTSRLLHNTKDQRLYCFHPLQCSCQSLGNSHQKLIHLPIPYSLRPQPYFEEEDDMVMQETPYFHEIEDGTRSVGNMLLTPYGVRCAKKQKTQTT